MMNDIFVLRTFSLFGWNPINLIEGEGVWFMPVAIACCLASLLSTILYVIYTRVQEKALFHKWWITLFITSFYRPLLGCIWYITAVYSIDLIFDTFVTDLFSLSSIVMMQLGAVLFATWALLRCKTAFFSLIEQKKIYTHLSIDRATISVFSKIATVVILAIAAIFFHDIAGMSMTTLWAFGGVGGLALAFASQDIVSNFFGGMMVHITRPFVVGEEIVVPSLQFQGTVEELGWYQTKIRSTIDKRAVYVPNSTFSKVVVINKSKSRHQMITEFVYLKIDFELLGRYIEEIEEQVASYSEIDSHERLSIWIDRLYGDVAKIGLYVVLLETSQNKAFKIKNRLLLSMAAIAKKYDATLVPPPNCYE